MRRCREGCMAARSTLRAGADRRTTGEGPAGAPRLPVQARTD
ncbi:hypothetical protein ATKI12_5162 [Kitasatospora sp. Ki12]